MCRSHSKTFNSSAIFVYSSVLTSVVEKGGDKGAVSEEGVAWRDILKVAFLKHGVFKHHRLHLQIQEPLIAKRKDPLRNLVTH